MGCRGARHAGEGASWGGAVISPRIYAAAALALALGAYILVLRADNVSLTAEIALKDRSIAALTTQFEKSAIARQAESVRAAGWAMRVSQLNTSIEALLSGDIPDAPLNPAIADFVNGLRQGPN